LRALTAADEVSKKEWLRSKFCEANNELRISGTAAGPVYRGISRQIQ